MRHKWTIYEEETGCVCVDTARDDVNKNFTITSCKFFYVVFVPLSIGQVSNEMCTQKRIFDDIIICSINSCTVLWPLGEDFLAVERDIASTSTRCKLTRSDILVTEVLLGKYKVCQLQTFYSLTKWSCRQDSEKRGSGQISIRLYCSTGSSGA